MNFVGNVTISVIHSPDVSNIFKENWFISTEHQPKQAKMTQKSPLHCIILLIPSMVLAVLWSKSFGHADKCLIPVCSEFCQNLEHETVYPSVLSY